LAISHPILSYLFSYINTIFHPVSSPLGTCNMAPTIISSRDATNSKIVGWVSDPNGRGTASLVISCLLTLGLCVWSALHLNIPAKGESRREYWLRRVKWSICGVLIPEIVVLLAWRQWTSAGRLTNEVNKVLNDIEHRSTSSRSTSKSNLRGADVRIPNSL
jgi:hypothetical protein